MFCEYCGASMSDNAKFCPACGKQKTAAAPQKRLCPLCGSETEAGDRFCCRCGSALSGATPTVAQSPVTAAAASSASGYSQPGAGIGWSAPQAGYSAPNAIAPVAPVAGSVPKRITGRRAIQTTRSFTHEELLRFLSERWDTAEYNQLITDPSMSQYTKRYVVLPATARYMIIVYPDKKNQVILSYIPSPAGRSAMLLQAIPTQNAFFGMAKIANTMSVKAEREGPLEDILQKYADYLYALLQASGLAR
mgnify:CR=1 FL=1